MEEVGQGTVALAGMGEVLRTAVTANAKDTVVDTEAVKIKQHPLQAAVGPVVATMEDTVAVEIKQHPHQAVAVRNLAWADLKWAVEFLFEDQK